ncbi:hypothetical protein WR25_00605 isoform B [Diploscapter pachys]|uniref:Uncharacterized protein n=1 Tax=Diploscapter pachys TaxID=2018661 RepID=A0A2A2KIE8_9BILA|nr:hypothetical protein WR25_00605 isoform A [Diploscapter pachys]PAV73629.1 hypothetical protein WR25_00605 isoform B [Diploscapter pachys]
MWFEERSWSNLRVCGIVEEWRDLWSSKGEFVLSAIAYVIATTNLLNLPKLILENGGLAFLVAYATSIFVVVFPTIILEMSVGQMTGRAPPLAFYNISPVFKGIGVSQILFTVVVLTCMTRFLGWLCIYFYHIIWTIYMGRHGLPWLSCRDFQEFIVHPCREAGAMSNFTNARKGLTAVQAESSLMQYMTSIEQPSESIAEFGNLQFYLLVAMGAVWVFVFLAICFGVRWIGKVVAFLLAIATTMMIVLFIYIVTSYGFDDYKKVWEYYLESTNWELLKDYKMWKVAVEQAIIASGIGFGVFITMASYNQRSNNLVCDSFIVVVFHLFYTVFQLAVGLAFVAIVARKTGLPIIDLLDKGESQMWHYLTYFSYEPYLKLWSGLFLVLAISVLLNILILLALNILSTMEDGFGEWASRTCPRFTLSFIISAFIFGLSVYFATQAGRHAYELATGFIKYITIFVILAFELFVVAYIYCAHRLGVDLKVMLHKSCCWCFGHTFLFLTYLLPPIPVAIAVINAMQYDYASTFSPPIHAWEWSEYVGAAIALAPLVPIPLYFLFIFLRSCCCPDAEMRQKESRCGLAFGTRLTRDVSHEKMAAPAPRYTSSAPGYLLLPQAPLAEPETYA